MAIDFDDSILQWGAYPAEDFLYRDIDCALVLWVKVPVGATTLQWIAGMDAGASASNFRAFGAYYRGDQTTKNISYFKASVDTHYNIGVPTPDGWTCVVISRPTSGGANTSTSTKMAVGATDSTQNTFANTAADLGRFIVGAIRDVFATPQYKNRSNVKLWGWAIYQRLLTDTEINTFQGGGTVDDVGGVAPVVYHYFETPNAGLTTSVSQVGARTMTFTGAPVADADTPFSAYSIASVNDDDEINAGAVNTAQVAGYVAGVNPVGAGTVGSLALTGVSQTGTEVTFTPPAPTNAAYWPEPDATHTLTLTDGTNPSTFSAPFRPLPGYTSVVVASPDNADEYKLGYWSTFPLEDDDVIMFDPPNPPLPDTPITGWDVNPDGSFTNAPDGLKTWYHWRKATSLMYIYEATIGGGVIIDNRLLSGKKITATKISASKLMGSKFR